MPQKLYCMKTRIIIILLLINIIPSFSQNRLTPETRVVSMSSFEYYQRVDSLLFSKENGRYKFALQVLPSFAPEYGLVYSSEAKQLILREANMNIWYGKRQLPKIEEYRLSITTEYADKLDSLLLSAVLSSSYLSDSRGHDGTVYNFRVDRGCYSASCWSPKNGNCARLVSITEEICKGVKFNDTSILDELSPEIDLLTNAFLDLLPEGGRLMDENGVLLIESKPKL